MTDALLQAAAVKELLRAEEAEKRKAQEHATQLAASAARWESNAKRAAMVHPLSCSRDNKCQQLHQGAEPTRSHLELLLLLRCCCCRAQMCRSLQVPCYSLCNVKLVTGQWVLQLQRALHAHKRSWSKLLLTCQLCSTAGRMQP